jgi:uncharacterized protein (TIGR02246 family)
MTWTGSSEDRQAIRELLDSYADAVNQRDADAWGATWAEDAVWNLSVIPGMEDVVGRDNIVAAWIEAMKLFPFIHMMCAPGKIEIDGDRAVVRSYTSECGTTADGKEIRPVGRYDDVCVKRDGRWLFERRTFTALYGE